MPVRRIPKNYLGVTGAFASRKNRRALGFESLLERDFMILLEFDPEVASFEEQPARIPVTRKGKRPTTYVPDVLVHYHPGRDGRIRKSVLTEVKKRTDLEKNKKKYAPKFAAARQFAIEKGWEFRTVSDREIRSPRLANLKFLREYLLIEPSREHVNRVLHILQTAGGKAEVQDVLERYDSETERLETLPVIWHLVATDALRAELKLSLTNGTVISLPPKGKRQ